MKKYQAIPRPPIVFDAVQYTTDFNLESIADKIKKINDAGRHFVEFFIKGDALFIYKAENYGIGMAVKQPIEPLSYLAFTEDDVMIYEEEEFEEDYEEVK